MQTVSLVFRPILKGENRCDSLFAFQHTFKSTKNSCQMISSIEMNKQEAHGPQCSPELTAVS